MARRRLTPAAQGRIYYYLESDGQVFLIKRRGMWDFPSKRSELPCPIKPLYQIPFENTIVVFAKPTLQNHPFHWEHKDAVIGRSDVSPLVQKAVNRSLPRAASKVVIIEKGRVLMVKAARGITAGYWNIPGGFVGYGEHPADSARREVYEELGLRVRLTRLIGIFSDVFKKSGGYMISFVYLGKRGPGKIRPHPEEIDRYEWQPVRQALRSTMNPFARAGLRTYLKGKHRN